MFRSSRRFFKFYYYMSSLLPIYLFIVIFMIAIKFNIKMISNVKHFLGILEMITPYKIVLYIFLALVIISLRCLFITRKIITDTKHYSKTFGITNVSLKDEYNPGFREFILSVILPMMSTFSIDDNPIPTLLMISIFQLLIYVFFVNSSDFFPNIPLVLLGYSVFIVDSKTEISRLKFVFGKNKNIDNIVNGDRQLKAVEIGEPDSSNTIGVIFE